MSCSSSSIKKENPLELSVDWSWKKEGRRQQQWSNQSTSFPSTHNSTWWGWQAASLYSLQQDKAERLWNQSEERHWIRHQKILEGGLVNANEPEGIRGDVEILNMLSMIVVTQVCTLVKTHQTLGFKQVNFLVYKSYLNKFFFNLHSKILKMKVKAAQSCPTLCNPMDCSLAGSSVHGIL